MQQKKMQQKDLPQERLLFRNISGLFAGLLLSSVLFIALILPGCSKPVPHNIIFIMIDTLRADHLGIYGYERDTSPNIDGLARDGLLFRWAIAPAPWTPPSVASMFTGLYPSSHGMMPPNKRELAEKKSARLDESHETLAERLRAAGYSTAAISTNPWISKSFGFEQGFDHFESPGRLKAPKVNEMAISTLAKLRAAGKPFFLYLHYMDVHDRGDNLEAFPQMFIGATKRFDYPDKMQAEIGLYDGEVRFIDQELGLLLKHLADQGLYQESFIILIGDHGEQFMERGNHGHGFQLFNEELRVPLMIKAPKSLLDRHNLRAGMTFDHTVSVVDSFATVLDASGADVSGEEFSLSLLRPHDPNRRPGVFSEIFRVVHQHAYTTFEGRKLIKQFGEKFESRDRPPTTPGEPRVIGLYDRRSDPYELKPIEDAAISEGVGRQLKQAYANILRKKIDATEVTISDETLDVLKSLGYAD